MVFYNLVVDYFVLKERIKDKIMKLISSGKTKNIPFKIEKYDTFFKRFRGLQLRRKPLESEGIWLIPCDSIHMFFMFFSIDTLFLDKNNKIVYLKENVKPWTVIGPKKNAYSVIEIPAGSITKYGIQVGDLIEI